MPHNILDELRADRKPAAKAAGSQEPMQRHSKEERQETWQAAVVDLFDDEP